MIAAIAGEYALKIAFCAGIIPHIEWLKEYEKIHEEILRSSK